MIVGKYDRLGVFALACAVLVICGQALGQPPTQEFNYPSTGVPPWTPSAGIPVFREKPRPDTERLLLVASDALLIDGRDDDAITVLKMLLDVKHEPRTGESYGFNTQHAACTRLSEIYERHGDVPRALRFAIFARERYPFSDWCGVAVMGVHRGLDDRIKSLNERLNKDAARRLPDRTKSPPASANPLPPSSMTSPEVVSGPRRGS